MDKPKTHTSLRMQKLFTSISKRLISKHIAENYTKEVADLKHTEYWPIKRSQDTEPSEEPKHA